MLFVQGRPRFWVPSFDTPHLVVPGLLLVVGLLLALLPSRPLVRTRVPPPAPAQINPTLILSPTAGAVLTAGQSAVIEGLAQPGGIVRLYWYSQPIGEPTRVALDGRWQFTIASLPPGTHSLRAGALVAGRSIWSGETIFNVSAPPARPSAKPAPKAGTKAKAPAPNRKPQGRRP